MFKFVTPRYENLVRIARERQCKRFLEIGTWAGITARNLIIAALESHPANEIHYTGIDLFESATHEMLKAEHTAGKAPQCLTAVHAGIIHGLGDVEVILHEGLSRDILPKLEEPCFDLIFIDGGHSAGTIFQDWQGVQRFIGKYTVIVFDDYRWNTPDTVGCKGLVDALDQSKWRVEILEPTEEFKSTGPMNMALVEKA